MGEAEAEEEEEGGAGEEEEGPAFRLGDVSSVARLGTLRWRVLRREREIVHGEIQIWRGAVMRNEKVGGREEDGASLPLERNINVDDDGIFFL